MSRQLPPPVDEALWAASLLSTDSELLLGAARNYLGPVKTPYDKREIVGRLTAFLRRAEVQEAVLALLDDLDTRILGTCRHLGPLPEAELRALFEGELPLFDLGLRLANLQDRLILFRFEAGGRRLLALNPVLAEVLAPALTDPARVFGAVSPLASGEAEDAAEKGGRPQALSAEDLVAFFLFLLHQPQAVRKGGGLTKKALDKARALLPAVAAEAEAFQVLSRAFAAAGFLGRGAEEREADPEAFGRALEAWGETLPAYLAAALARGGADAGEAWPGAEAEVAEAASAGAAALEAAPAGLRFSRGGFARWFEIVARRSRRGLDLGHALAAEDLGDLVEAFLSLGLLSEEGGVVSVNLPWAGSGAEAPRPGACLVAEGSHALHLLPEADLGARLFVGRIGRLTQAATVWSYEVDRESVRRALATGLDSGAMVEGLVALGGKPLPQALTFSLKAWEEEYRSLRLYRGFVLAVDERLRPVVEASKALAPRIAERLAPGVYVLAVSGPEEAAALLEEAGFEAPPETRHGSLSHGGAGLGAAPVSATAPGAGLARSRARARAAAADLAATDPQEGAPPARAESPNATARVAALLSFLEERSAPGGPGPAKASPEYKELLDRIERRLILTPRQLEAAELRPERLEATGLDYLGKVRLVERALRGQGERLEILFRLPGGEPTRALVRPVRLDKAEKGLVLEAEDLGTGGPIRIPLGAASSVRRMRASLFGDDT